MLNAADELQVQGEKLRQLVLTHYTWDGLTRQVCQLYEELAGAAHRLKHVNVSEQK